MFRKLFHISIRNFFLAWLQCLTTRCHCSFLPGTKAELNTCSNRGTLLALITECTFSSYLWSPAIFYQLSIKRTMLPTGHPSTHYIKVYTWKEKDMLLREPACDTKWSNRTSEATEANGKERFLRQLKVFMEVNGIKEHGDKSQSWGWGPLKPEG